MISKKDIFTIPNLLSLLRLGLIPLYSSLYLHAWTPDDFILAAGILALSCLTDLLDGLIARRFRMVSTLGKFLDPLADKITQLTVLLLLSRPFPLVRSLIPLFLGKELIQCALAYFHFRRGKMLDGALWTGKTATAVMFLSMIFLMMKPNPDSGTVNMLVLVNGFFLILALGSYLAAFLGDDPRPRNT